MSDKELNQGKKSIPGIVDDFFKAGIREFFVGYNPFYWHDKYWFEVSPNGRFGENEQITSYRTLDAVISYIHNQKNEKGEPCEVFMAINGRYYTSTTMELLKRMIDEALELKIDGFIVWSIEVLSYLASIWYTWKVNISTIMSIYNEDAISFLIDFCQESNLKLNRVILPREVTISEIEHLTKLYPTIPFEVFGEGDYCRYANWNCLAEHKYFSRDICTFALNQGLDVKRRVRSDFREKILDKTLSIEEKHDFLDNNLRDINEIFVQQVVSPNNTENNLMQQYINKFIFKENVSECEKDAKTIFSLMKIELILNFHKYIWDGLQDELSLHNRNIDNFITLYKLITPFLTWNEQNDPVVSKNMDAILKIRNAWKEYFKNEIKTKGKYWLETYYKFILYNRTSIPIYHYFNALQNVKVLKIPLRWRNVETSTIKLQLLEDALNNPNKYIDIGNLSGKYFHYDITERPEYKEKLNQFFK